MLLIQTLGDFSVGFKIFITDGSSTLKRNLKKKLLASSRTRFVELSFLWKRLFAFAFKMIVLILAMLNLWFFHAVIELKKFIVKSVTILMLFNNIWWFYQIVNSSMINHKFSRKFSLVKFRSPCHQIEERTRRAKGNINFDIN